MSTVSAGDNSPASADALPSAGSTSARFHIVAHLTPLSSAAKAIIERWPSHFRFNQHFKKSFFPEARFPWRSLMC